MTDFFNSKFVSDLKDGKLPPVEIEVPARIFIYEGLTIIISALIILIAYNLMRK